MDKSDFIILNGFDRSGSSAISRTLANHPEIELIMQPFNSGFVRKDMYRAIEYGKYINEAEVFFADMENNRLNNDLIHSHWHEKYSTTKKHIPGKVHLVKTTINHFAQRWMVEKHPKIDVWGIWRNPFEIFHSIKKNDLQNTWYKDALEEVKPTVKEEKTLSGFGHFFDQKLSKNQELALLIAVRSYFFFYYLKKENLIRYEAFLLNPNKEFQYFTNRYGLSNFDFNEKSRDDLNITGKKFDPKNKDGIDEGTKLEIKPIFEPLMKLYQAKLN